jgi:vacuolar protein sorting-associated protein 13D
LKRHGAIILASVDFLGNPLGLLNDFNEGVSEFINEGNVGALVKNVAHGLSNSAAKFTGMFLFCFLSNIDVLFYLIDIILL